MKSVIISLSLILSSVAGTFAANSPEEVDAQISARRSSTVAALDTLNDDLYLLGTNIVSVADVTPALRYWVEQRCNAELTVLQAQQEVAPDFATFKAVQASINRWHSWLLQILNHAAAVTDAAAEK